MIELGQEAKDKVTGFKGIVTARKQYITGCDQYTISPPVDDKGDLQKIYDFDEDQIEIIGVGINPKKVQGKKPGGPHRQSRSAK